MLTDETGSFQLLLKLSHSKLIRQKHTIVLLLLQNHAIICSVVVVLVHQEHFSIVQEHCLWFGKGLRAILLYPIPR